MEDSGQNVSFDRRLFFDGLNQNQLKNLYSLAPIRKLETGDVLIRERDASGACFYIVLEGEISIVKGIDTEFPEEIALMEKGAWFGEIGFLKQIPRTASAVARKPSAVMGIDRTILEGLEEKTQVFFLKQLNLLAGQRIEEQSAREEKNAIRNRLLMARISEIHQKMASYTGSPMFKSLIDKIPRLPVFAGRLLVRLMENQSSAKEVSNLVKQDPSLVGIVLKCINSPYFALTRKISDIHQAVLLLGFNEIHRLIISEGLRRSMPDTSTFRNLHAHSLAISHIAFAVSLASRTGLPSQASTLGIIHDLGKSLVELIKKQNPSLGIAAELFDDAGLGAMLLKKWNLPESVWRSVEYQMHPEIFLPAEVPPELRENVAILYMAHLCLDFVLGKKIEPTRTIFFEEYSGLLGWGRLPLEKMVREKIVPLIRNTPQPLPAFLARLVRDF